VARPPLGCMVCVGAAFESYWTIDKNGARWDIYPQPNGDFSGYSQAYFPEALETRETESELWVAIAQFANKYKPTTVPTTLPAGQFKAIPSSPFYGPPGPPIDWTPPAPTPMAPTAPVTPQPPKVPVTQSIPIAPLAIGAVALLIFFGTLNVKRHG
jgi:hypothetical protein